MEGSKKKQVMVGIVAGCLVLAGAITLMTRSGGSGSTAQFKGRLCGSSATIRTAELNTRWM